MQQVAGKGAYGPLWVVGEGPGKQEVLRGEPFVGKTGKVLRRMVENAGMPWDQCWRDNALPVLCWIPTDLRGRDRLIDEWRGHLTHRLEFAKAKGVLPKCILACGAIAARRLVGTAGIKEAWGGVYDLPGYPGVKVVPTIHPAAAMRTKLQAEKIIIQRCVRRAVDIATGNVEWDDVQADLRVDPSAKDVNAVLNNAHEVVIDTEFNPKKKETWLIGLMTDSYPGVVWSINALTMNGLMKGVLKKHMRRTDLLKIAQWHYADVIALEWAGIDSYAPWFDTLVGFATLYPDLPVGLTYLARFYINGITNWKGMEHDDPQYNAIDVMVTRIVADRIRQEMSDANMWDLWDEEVAPTLPLLYGLQERGMQVDKKALRKVRKQLHKERAELAVTIEGQVAGIFDRRTEDVEKEINEHTARISLVEKDCIHAPDLQCELHPVYVGLRKKRWANSEECQCALVYSSAKATVGRDSIAGYRKSITGLKGKAKRWEGGFDPSNNDHLRWLLYDKKGLGLPVQRHITTKKPTANATAIARLLLLKKTQGLEGVPGMLKNIKRLQHLDKLDSTFYKPPMDTRGLVYPPYRMHGTGSGRPAGGDDAYLGEKGVSTYKFNALNIPDEVRHIYVPYLR